MLGGFFSWAGQTQLFFEPEVVSIVSPPREEDWVAKKNEKKTSRLNKIFFLGNPDRLGIRLNRF